MNIEDREELGTVFCDILQNFAFMFGEIVDEEDVPRPVGKFIQARMGFTGPFSGAIRLAMPESFCPEMAANMLGLDPDDEEVAVRSTDAFKELLNVTCGHLLTEIAGEEPVFDLTIPEVSSISDEEVAALAASPQVATIVVDENPVFLQMVVKK